MNLGKKIFELRKNKHLSQEQVAEKLHVTRQTVSNWELGETSPDLNQAKELAKFFAVSLDELVGLDSQNILQKKVSNVEKLAGVILTILKIMGILFILYLFFILIAIICFSNIKSENKNISISGNITCTLKNEIYEISLNDKQEMNCPNCSTKMINELAPLINWENLDQSFMDIENYFRQNGGNCL